MTEHASVEPRAKRISSLGGLILLSILSAQCNVPVDDGTQPPGDSSGTAGPQQVRVTHYTVAEGEHKRIGCNYQILASDGITIDGELIVEDDGDGDVILTAENGDIEINGKVVVERTNDTSSKKPLSVSTMSHSQSSPTSPKAATPQSGASIILTATGPNRNIRLGRFALLQSGRGRDASDETVYSVIELSHEGGNGSNGGDIVLEAPLGTLYLPENRSNGDPALFGLGDGGHGADIVVDRLGFNTDQTSFAVTGGSGGDSGKLVLDASQIQGVPPPEGLQSQSDLIEGGAGGRGGHVLWDNTPNGLAHRSGGKLTKKYPLEEIVVQGGRGGDGARVGGDGGRAFYWSTRVINVKGGQAASASAYGGDGGDVISSPVPILAVEGGDGGAFSVLGNDGAAGTKNDRDGDDGGDVLGQGGKGGDVLGGVLFFSARGGAGGNSRAARTQVPADLPPDESDADSGPPSHTDDTYAVISGWGGDGYGSMGDSTDPDNPAEGCDGCPGGNGGDTGMVQAYGGYGGSVLDAVAGSFGGRGGDCWNVRRPSASRGGDGYPPGIGGCIRDRIVEPGAGGTGSDEDGESGAYLGDEPSQSEGDCNEYPGEFCGTDLVCEEVEEFDRSACLVPGTTSAPAVGNTFSASYQITSTGSSLEGGSSTTVQVWESWGTYSCDGQDECGWDAGGIYSITTSAGTESDGWSGRTSNPAGLPSRTGDQSLRENFPRCEGSFLHFPGDGMHTVSVSEDGGTVTQTFSFSGCTEVLGIPSCLTAADFQCIQYEGGDRWYLNQIGSGDCLFSP